ncbi:hypothetical protein COCSUDRAFT_33300 [Coccomyxa subellipsoidea C-169]|uniref:Secreted protein n=1 Tax=Coccomyxa subellipsoidea (strain C-169) TaxID=574566 RepID=I0YY33_COCSC|nr:hypothetical protein COCSUDRAFT_33300 [Coccomyxa subellipsoidea C-169]EIE23302.1 hypothetical protein COCSUDRAFT_33300 [Coccomyxa subellipsoidea C-169]|eukprot:XP_005647846.1 hypothetical protein COCSUDRAFT_33300 [Coccomyxa subellipsoidea C-169]
MYHQLCHLLHIISGCFVALAPFGQQAAPFSCPQIYCGLKFVSSALQECSFRAPNQFLGTTLSMNSNCVCSCVVLSFVVF